MGERNYVWGTLSATIKRVHEIHPELQIGIGLVASLAWIGLTVFALWMIRQSRRTRSGINDNRAGSDNNKIQTGAIFLPPLIIATTLFYLIGMRYWNGYSPWEIAYVFPGAKGVRAVARYVMVLALPMSIGFAYLLDRASKKIASAQSGYRSLAYTALLLIVVTFGIVEQSAVNQNFNGFSVKAEREYLNNLAARLPDDCSAFYVGVGPTGTRNEFEYQIDAIMVAVMRDVPTLNGYSGQLPPDWPLWGVKVANYPEFVDSWVRLKKIPGKVCRLDITDPTNWTY